MSKKLVVIAVAGLLLAGCSAEPAPTVTPDAEPTGATQFCDQLDKKRDTYDDVMGESPINAVGLADLWGWGEGLKRLTPDEIEEDVNHYLHPIRAIVDDTGDTEINMIEWTSSRNNLNQFCIQESARLLNSPDE